MEKQDTQSYEWLKEMRVPLVFYDRYIPGLGFNNFFRTTFTRRAASPGIMNDFKEKTIRHLKMLGFPNDDEAVSYYLFQDFTHSEAYKYQNESIWILEDGIATEFSKASDTRNIMALTETVVKHYVVHLKEINEL